MPEKTMMNGKRIILLRSLSLVLVFFSLFIIALPTSAVSYHPNADIVDYVDYIDSIESYSPDTDIVSLSFPSSICYCATYDSVLGSYTNQRIGDYVRFKTYSDAQQSPIFFPLGWVNTRRLSLDGIPDGTWFKFWYDVSVSSASQIVFADRSINTRISYWDKNGYFISEQITNSVATSDSGYLSLVISDIPANAYSCSLQIEFWSVRSVSSENVSVTVTLSDFVLEMELSALQVQGDLTMKQQALLDELNKNQQVSHEKLDEIKNLQQETNDKLDELPGNIGDEMQGIIDNEKAESESEGNKFVDQILDTLPDPSTDVLAALKSLTDCTAYTGTDAVLPIPAIVLPGIDGLFPETEIWGGTNFDFGAYIQLLPPALLTLVQALFTIAIVIFCVFELKGIISYCLTLRENKGG